MLDIAQEIEELNNANLAAQGAEVTRQQTALRSELYTLLVAQPRARLWSSPPWPSSACACSKRRSEEQKAVAQQAERHLRELSQQLVAAQEEERRKLSRELHDHVGQMLTALRMELGRIDRARRRRRIAPRRPPCHESPSTGRRDGAHRPRPRARAAARACSTTSACSRRSNGRRAISRGASTCRWSSTSTAPLDSVERSASHLRLSRRAGSADQLRPACQRGPRRRFTVHAEPIACEVSVTDDGIGLDPARRAARAWACAASKSACANWAAPSRCRAPSARAPTLTIELPLASTEVPLARAAG